MMQGDLPHPANGSNPLSFNLPTGLDINPMEGEELERLGKIINGKSWGWTRNLSRLINRNESTIWRWKSGHSEIEPSEAALIRNLAYETAKLKPETLTPEDRDYIEQMLQSAQRDAAAAAGVKLPKSGAKFIQAQRPQFPEPTTELKGFKSCTPGRYRQAMEAMQKAWMAKMAGRHGVTDVRLSQTESGTELVVEFEDAVIACSEADGFKNLLKLNRRLAAQRHN